MTDLPRTAMATHNKNRTIPQCDPRSIYKACRAQEENVLKNWQGLHEVVYKLGFLDRPIFPASSFVPKGAENLSANDRDILDRALLGDRSRVVFSLLKGAASADQRLEILASWLKQERICKPEKILTADVRRLARRRFRGVSPKDTLYASLVEIWGPYFNGLMANIPTGGLTDSGKDRLRNLNYDHDAITFAGTHKDPIPAICEWLASRDLFPKTVDARTIRNAHSRCFGGDFSQTSFFFKQTSRTK